MARSMLAIAVASGKVGYVFLQGAQLVDWGIAVKVAKQSGADLVGYVQELINELKPDVVVTEKLGRACRKGDAVCERIQAIAELASHNPVLDISVPKPRRFASKYEEAAHLANLHPELLGYLPKRKRRLFDFEPRGMVVFEALSLARAVLDGRRRRWRRL